MEKLLKLFAALTAMLALPAEGRDEKAVKKALTDIEDFFKGDDAKEIALLGELKEAVAKLRADVDAEADARRNFQRAGLAVQGRSLEVQGYDEIMSLRRVGRVFRSAEQAEQFGALCARSIFGKTSIYPEIVAQRTREMADDLVKQLDPGVATAGAELVANMYMADLIANVEAEGVFFTLCDRVMLQTTGQTIWPKLTGELTAYPTAVAAAITASAPTFATIPLTPVKWGTLTPVPNEFFRNPTLLDQLGQRLGWLITRAVARAADNALVNGDGTATYGNITGVLQDANITDVTAAAAATLGAYTGAEVSAVIAGLTKTYVTEPRWAMSLSAERTLRALKSTTGAPLYIRGSNGEPNTIDDYPYNICQKFPAAGSVGASTRWGIFGSMELAYYFGMLGSIEIAQSEHVRFESDVTVVRGIANFDAALKDADALTGAKTHA